MKKLLKMMAMLFACITIGAGLAACSSDDDEPAGGSIEQQIIGAWICNYGPSADDYYGYVFRVGGKGIYFDSKGEIPMIYEINGNKIHTIELDDGYQEYLYILEINDYELSLKDEDGRYWDFKRISENDLDFIDKDNPGNTGSSTDYQKLISDNVSISATYNDYRWNVKITSTLESKLPGKNVKFQLGHGENGQTECSILNSSTDPNFTIGSSTSNNTKTISYQFPFYGYFVALWNQERSSQGLTVYDYKDIITECQMYLASYDALKKESTLTSEQKDLFSALKKYLNEYELYAKRSYKVWVFVEIDGKRYPAIASYVQP